jgi:transposase
MQPIRTESLEWAALPHINPHAAGLDISATEIVACVRPDMSVTPIRTFSTYTPDLEALADWLQACHVTTVAMEATGVYWIPVYEILERCGFKVYLVNARHIKNVPGRKTDICDSQWVQTLHTYGLLTNSFVPAPEIRALRAYWRQRANLIEHRAAHIQHMQKALQQMNLHLTEVLSDITGVTGLQILRAIVAGERNAQTLSQLRDQRCRRSPAEIAKALTGNYRPEHVFALKQALALYDFYTAQIADCDAEMERQYAALQPIADAADLPPQTSRKRNSHSKNAPQFDARTQLFRITGVDLVAVTGLDESSVQTIISEIGTDVSRFPTIKHFCSWLTLAPHNDISGGKVLHSRTLKARNRAGQAFRMAAQAVMRTQTPFGAFYRRLAARIGKEQAIVATAHKIARVVYAMLKHHQPFESTSQEAYERQHQERELKRLKHRAADLGFQLVPQSG